ncbi:MAG: tetratricopeptide repeat protein [Candidatus Melainabacteria bacterium]|nr:tetratricopeptide repeat protein [Candidatus Melainabacteria bacterium]
MGSLGALPADAQQTDSTVIELNNEGVRALGTSNFKLAIDKFEAALKRDPSYQRARSNLAIAYNNYGLFVNKQSPAEALKYFHKALALDASNPTTKANVDGIIRIMGRDPLNFQDRVELGDMARKQGDFDGAIVEYQAAAGIKNDAGVREKLGDVLRVKGKLDLSINEYNNAVRIKDSAGLQVKLGQALQEKGDVAGAIGALGRALKMNSSDPDVLDALVTAWDAAVQANPTSPDNHVGLGQALSYRGDFDQAKEEYLQAIRFSAGKRNPTAEALLGKLDSQKKKAEVDRLINDGVGLQEQGKFDPAIEKYKMALALDPNNDKLWVNVGSAYQAKKDFQNAMQAYKQALNFNKANADAAQGVKAAGDALQDQQIDSLAKKGNDLFKVGKFDEAIAAYNQLLKFDANDAGVHFNLGAAFQAKKDYDSALGEYRIAKGIDAKNKNYADAYDEVLDLKAQPFLDQALALHKEKKYAQAIEGYRKYLAIRDKNDEVWYNMGAAQYSFTDYKSAQVSYKKAFDLDPKGRVDVLYFIGTIDEDGGSSSEAMADYTSYLQKAPGGTYVAQAKERLAALSKGGAPQKIKSEKDLANEKDAFDAFKQATTLQGNKQYDQALSEYDKALAIMPNNPDFVYGKGTVLQALNRYDDAIAQYNKAKSLTKGDTKIMDEAIQSAHQDQAQPLVDQAVSKQQAGDNAGAIILYKQVLQLIPENAKIWTNLGSAYQNSDQFALARQAYDQGYKADAKTELGNLFLMARIDENDNNGKQALSLYQLYVKTAGSAGAYFVDAKARVDALTKNISDTQKLSTTADIANAKVAEDAYTKGMDLQKNTKYDEAIAEYLKAAQAMPKEFAYPFAIATAYQAKGDLDNARLFYEKALTLTSNKDQIAQIKTYLGGLTDAKVEPLINDANAKYTAQDFPGAAAKYEEVLKITPNNADCWTFLAVCYQNMGEFAKARNAYEQGYKIGGKAKADNLYFLAVLDENDGNANQAIMHYTQYIQNAPSGTFKPQADQRMKDLKADPKALQKIQTAAQQKASAEVSTAYNDAVKLQGESKFDEALVEYGKAIAGSPNEPAYYYGRGTAYQSRNDAAKNDVDLAIADYDKAASMNPNEKAYKDAAANLRAFKAQPLIDSAIQKQTTALPDGKFDLAGAIADYRAALKINDDANTHLNLGTALQANMDNTSALQEYSAAINKNPSLADAYYYRGLIYEDLKQNEAAKKDYQKYLQLQPAGANAAAVKDRLKIVAPPAPAGKKR